MASRKKQGKQDTQPTNADMLRRAIEWIVTSEIFRELKKHGNTTWEFCDLVILAVFWAWSDQSTLVHAFGSAHALVLATFGQAAVSSYQGLTGALKTWTDQLLPILWCRIHELMKRLDGKDWRLGIWVVLAVDGSRISMPRTESNERRYCAPKNRKKNKKKNRKKNRGLKKNYHPQPVGPQMWLTLLWHVGYGIPWCWKTGPSNSSERDHFRQMLAGHFPENTLFCGDAGFVGYEFWKDIADHQHHFLVRVGANVKLLKKLGYVRESEGLVYCWPDHAAKKKLPPLVLRLWHFHDGRGDVYLVTNVLDKTKLSAKLAAQIYTRRWGIEVQFRSLKQTYGRGKLRSASPDCAAVELHWSLLALTMVQLLAVKEQVRLKEPALHTSVAAVLRAIRNTMVHWWLAPPPEESLPVKLRAATTDEYERHTKKQSRNYPRHKEEPSAGKPVIINATAKQKQQLTLLELETAA